MEVSQILKIKLLYHLAILLLDIYAPPPKKNPQTLIWQDTCMPILTTALFTIANIWKQPECVFDRWMDKENVVCIYNGVLLG